jgi:hypothetical protein
VLVLDNASRRLIDNVIEEDAILNENVTSTLAPLEYTISVRPKRNSLTDSRH